MIPEPTVRALPPQAKIGVIGAGAMGRGIAQVAASAGHSVQLFDLRSDVVGEALLDIGVGLNRLATKGHLDKAHVQAAMQRVTAATTMAELCDCALVIEAAAERLEVKREVFRELEAMLAPEAILASNTSSISITAIGAVLRRPERLVGMHFFNPAPVMALVEVVSGLATEPAVVATVQATARNWGKHAVRATSTPGFIVNRVARPFYAEGLRLLTEGASDPSTLDALLREGGGFRMGPFELMDLIGQDVNEAVTRSVFEAYHGDPRFAPSLAQHELVLAGRLGRKTGRGFYEYGPQAQRPAPSEAPAAPRPATVQIHGEGSFAQAWCHRLAASAVAVEISAACADGRLASIGEAAVFEGDGRTAAEVARACGLRDVVVLDTVLQPAAATRIAAAVAPACGAAAWGPVFGALQAAGWHVSLLRDLPGLAVLRTMVMLASEAADAVHQQVATASDVDIAMRLGVNYPEGPLAWADRHGVARVVQTLDRLAAFYGDGRYRASPLLRWHAAAGIPLQAEEI